MEKKMKKKTMILKGKVENLKRVPTSTANRMVTFTVGDTPCKAFGRGAETIRRWMQCDPNTVGEFQGHFDMHSERFGTEFVAIHGRAIQSDTITGASTDPPAVSGAVVSAAISASALPVVGQPITAKEPAQAPVERVVGKVETAAAAAPQLVATEKTVAEKTCEVKGAISKIKNTPTRDGRKMISFRIGTHNCILFGQAAEFVEKNAALYEGKLVAVYGTWKMNERGCKEFVPSNGRPAAQSGDEGALTASEVEAALEEALIKASGLRTQHITLEDLEAQYRANKERKGLVQAADDSAAAA
jgi:hypothetical protein